MTIKIVLALPLILLASALPAYALTKQEILEQEQQQFLNPQPSAASGSLEAEQNHFLKAKLPVVSESQPQSQPEQSTAARWHPQPVARPEVSPQLGMTPAAVPQIAFALPPSLDGFLNRLQLGAEQMLYPLVHPVAITSVFGWRTHPIYGGARFHTGIDLGTPIGSPVLAAFTGTVISADWMGGYGNVVLIQHSDGLRSLYGHLSRPMVRPGQVVHQGTVIGLSGSTGNSTGPHLHFEMRRLTGGEWVAFDPGNALKVAQQQLASALQTLKDRQVSAAPH
jgi:murein DD-endopeptidase MepM/ murein hydrolase activator NlpD